MVKVPNCDLASLSAMRLAESGGIAGCFSQHTDPLFLFGLLCIYSDQVIQVVIESLEKGWS
jgi:hypothetical protein